MLLKFEAKAVYFLVNLNSVSECDSKKVLRLRMRTLFKTYRRTNKDEFRLNKIWPSQTYHTQLRLTSEITSSSKFLVSNHVI